MNSDSMQLSDIANIQGGFAFKSTDFQSEGIAVVKIANIQPPFVSLASVDRVASDKLTNLDRFKLSNSDILMAMTGATVGKVGRFKETEPAYLNQRVARISAKKGRQFDDFIYAVVSQPRFDQLIEGASAGSAQANISANGIGSVQIPRTSDAEQLAIGKVARAIDDRITLLRESNETLEAIAQTLFKSWFVDFDPVSAKSEGKLPEGMNEATAALFPDAFDETDLGIVPREWRISTLSEVANLNEASWSARTAPSEVSYVDLAGVKKNVFDAPQSYLFSDAPSRARRILRSSDCIVGTVRPGNRSFGFIARAENNLTASTGFAVLSPKRKDVAAFVYLCATREANIDRLASLADGGAYPAVKPELVAATTCVMPTDEVMKAFDGIAKPLLDSIEANSSQAQTLASLRDTLLPRLISGRLRITDAEAELEKTSI